MEQKEREREGERERALKQSSCLAGRTSTEQLIGFPLKSCYNATKQASSLHIKLFSAYGLKHSRASGCKTVLSQ